MISVAVNLYSLMSFKNRQFIIKQPATKVSSFKVKPKKLFEIMSSADGTFINWPSGPGTQR